MEKTVADYQAQGFDKKMAEYFASGRRLIISVIPNDDFTLTISFDNGEKRLYDVRPFLKPKTIFEPLMKLEVFKRVYVDDTHCVAWDIDSKVDSGKVWNNKIDLSPDSCYVDSLPITINH